MATCQFSVNPSASIDTRSAEHSSVYDADHTRTTYEVVATMTEPKVNWHFMFEAEVARPVLFERFVDDDSFAKKSTAFGLNPTQA